VKKGIKRIGFYDGEAHLWRDEDEPHELSVSIDVPWEGFRDVRELRRLAKFLDAAADRIAKPATARKDCDGK